MSTEETSLENKSQPSCLGAVMPRFTNQRVTITEPFKGVFCVWQTYGVGTKRHYEYYKGENKIASFFESSYSDANKSFVKWLSENMDVLKNEA